MKKDSMQTANINDSVFGAKAIGMSMNMPSILAKIEKNKQNNYAI